MKAYPAEKQQYTSCRDTALEVVSGSVGKALTASGAEAVKKWLCEHSPELIWFTCEDQKGTAAFQPETSRLVFLGVLADAQHQGRGTALLDAVCAYAEHQHLPRICANAAGDALDFYRSYGFDLTGEEAEAGGLRYAPVEYLLGRRYLGTTVKVIVDRPYGSLHPHIADLEYELNFGYVDADVAEDGDLQDAWVYGVEEPIDTFTGTVIGIVYHKDGTSRLIVAGTGRQYRQKDVIDALGFEEQYFDTRFLWAQSIS